MLVVPACSRPRSALVIAAALPSLVRSAEEEFDPDTVTPGIWGFVLTFLIMVVVVLLVLDMVRRIRRVNYRAEVREQLEAERAAQEVQALEGDFAAPDAPEPGTEPGTAVRTTGPPRHPATTRTSRPRADRRASAQVVDRVHRDDQRRRPVAHERQHRAGVEDLVEPEPAGPRVRLLQRRRRSRRPCTSRPPTITSTIIATLAASRSPRYMTAAQPSSR